MNLEKWKIVREKGRGHFILVTGLLVWGISTAIGWSVIMQIIDPQEPIWLRPLVALVAFPIGGIVWAYIVWTTHEKKYNQLSI